MAWAPPKFRASTLPLSTLRVSSGELKFFFVVSAILVPPDERNWGGIAVFNWLYARGRVFHSRSQPERQRQTRHSTYTHSPSAVIVVFIRCKTASQEHAADLV